MNCFKTRSKVGPNLFTAERIQFDSPIRRVTTWTGVGRFGTNMLHWGLSMSNTCDCGAEQTADHITSGCCPIYRPPEGMNGLIELDVKMRTWLENSALDV